MLVDIAFAAIVISQSGWLETKGRNGVGWLSIPEVGNHPAAAEDIRPVEEDIQAHQQSAGGIEDPELRSIPDQT